MGSGKIITGIISLIAGIILSFFILPLGVTLIVVGLLFIIFNSAENQIEARKDLSKSKRNKNPQE
ncbi:MAG: hypothetical protein Q8Q31_04925 [Nanoarchaeota archaeon]|nr:hypothetical protein [Nanoarchaeota archaeon]